MASYTSAFTGAEIDKAIGNANKMLLTGSSDPTTATVGTLGQIYQNTTNGALFRCVNIAGAVYTWEAIYKKSEIDAALGLKADKAKLDEISENLDVYIFKNKLITGDLSAGYYGKVTNLITGTDLCTVVGLTAGTLAVSGDITWLKFSHKYRTLFIPDRAIRTSISWDQIQAQNLVKGKVITINGLQYLCRLMTGGNSNPANTTGGEWNDLIVAFTPNDADSRWSAVKTWMQEISSSAIASRIYRGNTSVSEVGNTSSSTATSEYVYRPVLELL